LKKKNKIPEGLNKIQWERMERFTEEWGIIAVMLVALLAILWAFKDVIN
jgi:hypothetical protein